jgi:hypothetical protein
LRVGGAKLTIDGSPQGFTALRDRPYYDPVGAYPPGYAGYAAATMEQVFDAIDWAFENGIQILTHANGEGASDMLIAAHRAATEEAPRCRPRPVLIHGQFLREDQVAAYNGSGCSRRCFRCTPSTGATGTASTPSARKTPTTSRPPAGCFERGMMFSTPSRRAGGLPRQHAHASMPPSRGARAPATSSARTSGST